MARLLINIGNAPNDLQGDPLRVAFDKINKNFEELYDGESLLTADEIAAIQGANLPSAGNLFVTQDDLNSYISEAQLSTALSGYVTSGALTTALSDYVTNGSLSTTLGGYTTDLELTNAIADFITIEALDDYVTDSGLTTILGDYVTSGALTTTLGNYVTSSSLATTLSGYATDLELSTAIADFITIDALTGYVTDGDLSTAISGLISLSDLDGDRGDITVSSNGTSWVIDNSAVTTVKINDAAVTDAKIADVAWTKISGVPTFSGGAAGLVPTSVGGTTNFLRADGSWAAPAGGDGGDFWNIAGQTDLDSTGGVNIIMEGATNGQTSQTTYFPTYIQHRITNFDNVDNSVTVGASGITLMYFDATQFHQLEIDSTGLNINADVFMPNVLEGSGTRFLTVDDTTGYLSWNTVSSLTDGDKGDITVSASGATWTIDDGAITNAKLVSNAVTTVKINNGAVTDSKITSCDWSKLNNVPTFAGGSPGLVPTSPGGTSSFLRADGGWGSVAVSDGDKGDITVSASGATWTIDANAVSFSKLSNVVTNVFMGRYSSGTGNIQVMTPAQATSMLELVTSTNRGLAPASGGGTSNYLRADGVWATPPNTTYSVFTSGANGLVPASGGGTTNYLRADGSWASPVSVPANRIPYGTGTSITSSTNFTWSGSQLLVGNTTGPYNIQIGADGGTPFRFYSRITDSFTSVMVNAMISSGLPLYLAGDYVMFGNGSIPTSSAGLPSGAIWRSGDVLKIVL